MTHIYVIFFARKFSSFIILFLNLIYLSYCHFIRMFDEDVSRVGIETIYMISICKYCSISFGYEDGCKKDEELKNSHWRAK